MKRSQKFKCTEVSPDLGRFTVGQIYRRVLKLCDTIAVRDDQGEEHAIDDRGIAFIGKNDSVPSFFARFEPVEVR